jgi:DNA-binding GntR family transcriptional regulator
LKRVPVHRQLVDILRAELLAAQPGDRVGSQNELAARFGVSPTTVREAVNGLVQDGVLERRQGSGTYVADPTGGKVMGILIELDIACASSAWGLR